MVTRDIFEEILDINVSPNSLLNVSQTFRDTLKTFRLLDRIVFEDFWKIHLQSIFYFLVSVNFVKMNLEDIFFFYKRNTFLELLRTF